MSRITRNNLYIQIALLIAQRGTCKRMQVGAVLTLDHKIISTGYNGPDKEEEHCNSFQCDTTQACKRATHAEANAIKSAQSIILWPENTLRLYVTHQPCKRCAEKIIRAEIHEVYYLNEYREKAGIELLLNNNIKVIQLNEKGETKNPN